MKSSVDKDRSFAGSLKLLLIPAALVCALLVLRLAIVLTSVESVTYGTEIDLGTFAREISRGLRMPFWFFQMDNYSGESFILGPLTVPFFKIFGQNLFAIKMVPVFFSVLTLLAIYSFLFRHFSARAALFAGLLFVFSPPGVVQFSLVGLAAHSEAVFFAVLVLFSFFEFMYRGQKKSSLVLFGLISGFAVWYFYAKGITVLSCLLFLMFLDMRLFFRSLPVFALSFLAGFSPWILGNIHNHFLGIFLLEKSAPLFDGEYWFNFVRKSVMLLVLDLPSSLVTLPFYFVPLKVFQYVYYALILAAALPFLFSEAGAWLKSRRIPSRTGFWLLYPVLYALALVLSSLEIERNIGFIGYRYLAPVWILVFTGMGIFLAGKKKGSVLLAALVVFGLAGQASMFFKEPFGRALVYKGYSYYQLGTKWQLNLNGPFKGYDDFDRISKLFPEEDRRMLIWGISETAFVCGDGSTLFGADAEAGSSLTLETMRLKEPESYYPFTQVNAGLSAKNMESKDFEAMSPSARKYFCAGWLWNSERAEAFLKNGGRAAPDRICDFTTAPIGGGWHPDHLREPAWSKVRERLESFGPEEKKRIYRAFGAVLGSYSVTTPDPQFSQPYLERWPEISPQYLPDVYWGIGWQIRESYREDKDRALDWIDRLPPEARGYAVEGLKAFDEWNGLSS